MYGLDLHTGFAQYLYSVWDCWVHSSCIAAKRVPFPSVPDRQAHERGQPMRYSFAPGVGRTAYVVIQLSLHCRPRRETGRTLDRAGTTRLHPWYNNSPKDNVFAGRRFQENSFTEAWDIVRKIQTAGSPLERTTRAVAAVEWQQM